MTRGIGGRIIIAVMVLALAGPYFLGAWVAVRMGADNPSTTRTLVGWLFEIPWVLILAFVVFLQMRKRAKYQAAVAEYNAVRPVPGPGGSTVYHHGGCTIDHRTAESAAKCRKGVAGR